MKIIGNLRISAFNLNFEPFRTKKHLSLEITKKHLKYSDMVLDFACATGLYSIALAGNVKEIHGIDISSRMIETANRKAGRNVNFSKATIFETNNLPPMQYSIIAKKI